MPQEALWNFPSPERPRLVDIGVNLADKQFVHDVDEVRSPPGTGAAGRGARGAGRGARGTSPARRASPAPGGGTGRPRPPAPAPQVLERAAGAGVSTILTTGCCLRSSRRAAALTAAHGGRHGVSLYHTAGVHPHNAKQCDGGTLRALRELLADPRCLAVGECGLDFNRNFSPPEVQERWFRAQVALAAELGKPLFLHCRDAGERFVEILSAHELRAPAVVHCFTGTEAELRALLALGCHVGVTGWVCDERGGRGEALARLLPLVPRDRLMIETDAPWIAPRSIRPARARPRRCEPCLLPHVCARVAAALGVSYGELARLTTANAERVFGMRPPGGAV